MARAARRVCRPLTPRCARLNTLQELLPISCPHGEDAEVPPTAPIRGPAEHQAFLKDKLRGVYAGSVLVPRSDQLTTLGS